MATAESGAMPDEDYRGILTDREEEILLGEADVSDSYRYRVVSRVRSKIEKLAADLETLDATHETLGDELRDAVCSAADPDRQRLEEAARERWGEEWAIQQRHWSDGTTSAHAFHLEPTDDPDVVLRDRLFVGADGDVYHERIRVRREETLDVLERDEPPEEATSEFIVEE